MLAPSRMKGMARRRSTHWVQFARGSHPKLVPTDKYTCLLHALIALPESAISSRLDVRNPRSLRPRTKSWLPRLSPRPGASASSFALEIVKGAPLAGIDLPPSGSIPMMSLSHRGPSHRSPSTSALSAHFHRGLKGISLGRDECSRKVRLPIFRHPRSLVKGTLSRHTAASGLTAAYYPLVLRIAT